MGVNKINEIINHFSEEEKDDFYLYAIGPFWKLQADEKEYLKALVYQDAAELSLHLDKNIVNHRLLKIANSYLVHLELEAHPLAFQEHLIMAQIQNGCEKNYRASIKVMDKMLKEGKGKDQKFHGYEMDYWKFKEAVVRDLSSPREGMMQMNKALDAYFIENKLWIMTEMANRRMIMKEDNFEVSIPLPWKEIASRLDAQPLGIQLFYLSYQLMQDKENMPVFTALDKLFQDNHHLMEVNYKQTVLTNLMNICVQKVNKGMLAFGEKYLSYIDLLEREDMLLEKQQILPSRFQNAVGVSLKIGAYDWCMRFVNKYESKYPEHNKEAEIALARANIYFHQGNFIEARKTLILFNRKEVIKHIRSERLHMKILFELQDYEKLNTTAQNFMRYVRTNPRFPTHKKKSLHTFARMLNRLAKYKGNDPRKVAALRARVEADPEIIDKAWLLEKME